MLSLPFSLAFWLLLLFIFLSLSLHWPICCSLNVSDTLPSQGRFLHEILLTFLCALFSLSSADLFSNVASEVLTDRHMQNHSHCSQILPIHRPCLHFFLNHSLTPYILLNYQAYGLPLLHWNVSSKSVGNFVYLFTALFPILRTEPGKKVGASWVNE